MTDLTLNQKIAVGVGLAGFVLLLVITSINFSVDQGLDTALGTVNESISEDDREGLQGSSGIPTDIAFEDIEAGESAALRDGVEATVHFAAYSIDGYVYDTTFGGEPYTYVVGEDDPTRAWAQGLNGMMVGGTRVIAVPPGYESGNVGLNVPNDAPVLYEIVLIGLNPRV